MANTRWIRWAARRGESRHIKAFASRDLTTVTVSGLRNTLDLLRDLELGRLHGVDFVECRVCDLGCIGGIGNAESRFLGQLRTEALNVDWSPSEEERAAIVDLYDAGVWRLPQPLSTRPGRPLAENLNEAMDRLNKMKEIFAGLPHIDCGACGRPSCKAMAEDIVRGYGETTDCIFKLRERISTLAADIIDLSTFQPQTLRGRGNR